ncbi:MAG: site-specific tyrosine recombinase XerC [Gammaproteobacteria bacterium]|nr:site-specific tyrosine recombinase XerC [Gammaproteobacteria bacterium]
MRRAQRKNAAGLRSRRWQLPANGLSRALRDFIDATGAKGLSPRTLQHRQRAIKRFILWGDERGLNDPREITLPILERYQRHLYHYRKPNGEPLSFSSQYTELAPLKAFFRWLTREHHILYNPASELELPKVVHNLARYVLSVADVERIIAMPDTVTLLGLRDRTILEVLYSSAIRRSELMRLLIYDVDTKRGSLLVRNGKGAKDRIVPLGERACGWVDRYRRDGRDPFISGRDEGIMFLTSQGDALTDDHLTGIVKEHIQNAGITMRGACHLFRHACATHMLDNGADTRFIQALLGHASLESTQIYTHVALNKLKAVHEATHPATCHRNTTSNTTPNAQRDALLTVLAREVEEEETETESDTTPPQQFYRRPYAPRPNRRGPRKKKDESNEDVKA